MNPDTAAALIPLAESGGPPSETIAGKAFREGRIDDAESICRQRLRRNPRDVEALHLVGLIAWKRGRTVEACESMRRAVEIAPDDPLLRNYLGEFLLWLGQLEEAERQFRQALATQPGFADALYNLGNVRRLRGDLHGALDAYEKALERSPRMAVAHNNIGFVLFQAQRIAEAAAKYRDAVAIDPNFVEAWNNLGTALAYLNQSEEAIAALNQALALRPDYPEALNALGLVMIREGRHNEARTHLMRALSLDPDYCGAYHNLGTLNHAEGRFVEAQGCYRKALALDPEHLMSYAGLVSTQKIAPEQRPLVDKLEALAASVTPGDAEAQAYIHFAIGKARDDLHEFDAAFAHYEKGNRKKRESLHEGYDRALHEAEVTRAVERFDLAHFERYRPAGNPSELPVFIVGMMRSGTTLVEQILASHPQVFGAGELQFWKEQDIEVQTNREPLSIEMIAAIAERALARLGSFAPGQLRVTDKLPHNFMRLGLIHTVFPRARIIHCRRNPADTCLSIYFQNFPTSQPYAYDLGDLAHFYEQYRRLTAHWHSVIGADVLMEVEYEELVGNQEAVSRRMVEFCGLGWNDRCLAFHRNPRRVLTASLWQVRQPIYKDSVARWKHYEPHLGPLARLLPASG